MRFILFSIVFVTFHSSSLADYLVYKPKQYSSWLPVQYYLNTTFDVIQNPNWFNQDNFFHKHEIVWERIKDPVYSIKKDGGLKKLLADELLTGRVLPNLALHTIGNSLDTRLILEYFKYKQVYAPEVWTFLLTFSAHIGNEALETSQIEEITSHDHIIDLYFFDLLGHTLAFNDDYIKFLKNDLGMKAWHYQPTWSLDKDDFFNTGVNYIYRPQYFSGDIKPILFSGMQNMLGSSFYKGADIYSLLAGISLTDPLRQKGRFVIGVFYENNEFLSSSILLNGSENYRWRLNLYPHFWKDLKNENIDLGLILGETSLGQYSIGLNLNLPFALGKIDI